MTANSFRARRLLPVLAAVAMAMLAFAPFSTKHADAALPECQGGFCKTSGCDEGEVENESDTSCPENKTFGTRSKCCQTPIAGPAGSAPGAEEEAAINLVEPSLSVPIPTIKKFSDAIVTKDGLAEQLSLPWIGDYIQGIYDYAIGVAGVLAAVMMMIGGFQYLIAGGDAARVSAAKKRIMDALVGLVLVLTTYLILGTVSGSLLNIPSIRLEMLKREEFALTETDTHDEGAVTTGSGALCTDKETCNALFCSKPPNEWPTSGGAVRPPEEMVFVGSIPGISAKSRVRVAPEMRTALEQAGKVALGQGYEIGIVSAYRPLRNQIQAVCNAIKANEDHKIGTIVARPGSSNHGRGLAVDVYLSKNGAQLTTTSSTAQYNEKYRDAAGILAEIMAQAGLVRYSREIWHFEVGTGAACRCSGAACKFPPPKAPAC